jgi:hypothetical protein
LSAGPAELLADLAVALGTVGARWYVFGAQAVSMWGRPRLTTDVDVTVQFDAATDVPPPCGPWRFRNRRGVDSRDLGGAR